MDRPADLSFLAPPGEIGDWRLTLLFDVASGAGVLVALPGTADDLAARLGCDSHGLRVILDALAAWAVVTRGDDRIYRPGPGMPTAEQGLTLRHHARSVRRWSTTLGDRLRGAPDEIRPGMPDPEAFLDALAVGARRTAPGLVNMCLARFPDARRVLDLGGAHGEYALEFARRGLQATMQDVPIMIDIVARRGRLAAAGIELFAGSFFEAVPDGPFDLAFCCGITHTFDGDHNVTLYRRVRPVIAPGGGMAIVTFLRGRHQGADIFAVQMLANGNGGDSHGEDQYRAWLDEAGYLVDGAPIDVPDGPQSILFAT